MPRHIPVASLDYLLELRTFTNKSESEEHKLKALAGVSHLQGLGRLLRAMEACETKDIPAELLADRLEDLADGMQTVGELMAGICDGIYTEIEFMAESLDPSIKKVRLFRKKPKR